jgi:hypothetical protein
MFSETEMYKSSARHGHIYAIPLFHGATARSEPGPPHNRGFTTMIIDTHSVELLWTSDQPDAETSTG